MNVTRRLFDLALLGITVVMLSACDTVPRRDPEFAAAYPAAHAEPQVFQATSGAIYQVGYDALLFGDMRARRVGDILTITLSESNTAAKSSDTTIARGSDSTIQNPTVFGSTPQFDLPSFLPLASTKNATLESSLSASHDFSGEGSSNMSNTLTGNITVTVADVLPNGNLFVRGEKRLTINQGNEYIKISGIVRPIDIADNNSVSSTKVADATIVYSGDGAAADANRAGWLTRFFVSVASPF